MNAIRGAALIALVLSNLTHSVRVSILQSEDVLRGLFHSELSPPFPPSLPVHV
ncbi:hypothetical protein D3C80_2108380 [compost metagenome]